MKKISLFFLPLLLLVGCQDNGGAAREGAREAVDAPSRYLGANVRAQQQAQVTTAVNSVTGAVRMFQTQEGRYPQNLNELVQKNYLSAIPALPQGASFRYNAQTGEVAVDGY
jgi:hypothetical protein